MNHVFCFEIFHLEIEILTRGRIILFEQVHLLVVGTNMGMYIGLCLQHQRVSKFGVKLATKKYNPVTPRIVHGLFRTCVREQPMWLWHNQPRRTKKDSFPSRFRKKVWESHQMPAWTVGTQDHSKEKKEKNRIKTSLHWIIFMGMLPSKIKKLNNSEKKIFFSE